MKVSSTVSGSWDLEAMAADMRAATRAVGNRIAAVAKREQTAAARGMGSLTLSGMGAKLAVAAKVFPGAEVVTVDVAAVPAGPWAIAEAGRRGGYTVKPRRRKAVTTPKGPAASATIRRPTAGNRVWTRSMDAAMPAIDDEVARVFDDALGAE